VAGHVPSERAAMLVKQHGIDFLIDDDYLQTLRVAGGDDTVIAALRDASEAVTGELVFTTSPNAEVYLDGELMGKAGAQGEFVAKAKPGAHTVKVSLTGKNDFERNITLAAREGTKIQARLEDVGPPPTGTVRQNPKDGLKYVWIPPGTFIMGCSPGDTECAPEENPPHQVTITKGLWMGQTIVTVGAYKRFASATGRQMPKAPTFNSSWANDSMPIVNISWNDTTAFCGWAGGRLPTEAEWEHAARAGSTEARYGPLDEVAWHSFNSGGQTHPVAEKRANGFGLYDMLGNVWEWVNDWYDQNYYQHSPSQDPTGPSGGSLRVLRGASWYNTSRPIRVSYRGSEYPASRRFDNEGFRCAREMDIP